MMSIVDRARELRAVIEGNAQAMGDADALEAVELFPVWGEGEAYYKGERVQHGGVLFSVLQAHTSQAGWEPGAAPSLFAKVLIPDPDAVPEWEQPDSTNPYMKGDKVTHKGKTWISAVDGNVWEPGVYGWDEI